MLKLSNTTTKRKASSVRKGGEITRTERVSAAKKAESVLEKVKEKSGDVILVAIDSNTMIELPANLSDKEIDERIKKHIKRYKGRR